MHGLCFLRVLAGERPECYGEERESVLILPRFGLARTRFNRCITLTTAYETRPGRMECRVHKYYVIKSADRK